MISGLLSAELSATCNALGYSTGTTYHIDHYAKETITDLIRYLRRDEEDHSIRRHLGQAKILQTDLLPILIHHSDKEELFDVLLRLLVNLTNPALLIYQEELPADRTSRHYYMQIISHLQSYKEAFTQQRVWEVLVGKLEKLLNVPYNERDEDQSRTMERILILARNVLQVPADSEGEKRPDNDASVHDQVLWCLHQAGMVDLFLYIASTDREQQYYMHILEIVSLMLREQNPASLASAALQRSVEEKERDEKELLELRRRETLEKQSKIKKYAGSRHSRFGGTFIMKDVKSISDKDLIYHKPLNKAVSLTLDFGKQRARVPKNKLALTYQPSERRSAFSVRLFLKEFCVEFLNGAYNPLMYKVRENLVRAVGQPNDETYYFWAMKFFMEFNRLYKFQVKLVSETMHQQIFHFVQTQMENWLEMMITDKKHIPIWSRRVHQALKAYQELLMTLQEMDRSPEESVRRSAIAIKSNVFYQSEYRELVVFLFNVYTEMKFSRAYLKDLVETTHIFMKMLEQFCKRHQNLVVQGKPKKKPVKKKKPAKDKSKPQLNLEALWDEVGPVLSAVLQGEAEIPTDIVPFDAASGRSMEEEKVEAMKRIKAEMMQSNFEVAVGLLRASRDVWPENDSFGRADMPPEEEFLAMREIFMTDIGQLPDVAASQEEEENEEADDEEEGGDHDIVIPESVFKFDEFVGRFAAPKVLAPVCSLLDNFEHNSVFTNKCILKLLHRVSVDLKMPQMLFQATVFRTFQRAFKSTNPEHKEIARLGKFIVREFARMAKTNKKIYMEILFWKTNKEAYELEYGYGSSDTKSHSAKNVWGEEQEDELRRLAQEYEEKTPEDEPDAVNWIMKNMINQSRSRKAVIKKLKELYLFVGNMKPKPKKSKEMSEEEISQLKSLFEEYKDSPDPMNCILGRLSVPRSRNVIANKLLDLGLISDRKELRKKRSKKIGKSGKELEWGDRSDDESIYDSWSDEDGGPSTSSTQKKKKNPIRSRFGQPTVPQMCCNLKKVMDSGDELREALEWLQSSLQEALDDLADAEADDEGTALLPLTPSCVQAMDNPLFMQLMDILSIHKPTDQEMYWRIPGTWKSEDLSMRINLIKDALEGNLPEINPDEVEKMVQLPGIPLNKPEEVKKNKPKKKVKKSLEKFIRKSGDSDSEDTTRSPLPATNNTNKSRAARKVNSGGSSSDDEYVSSIITSSQEEKTKNIKPGSGSDKENNSDSSKTSRSSLNSGTLRPLPTKKTFRIQSESEESDNSEPSQKTNNSSYSNNSNKKEETRGSSLISNTLEENHDSNLSEKNARAVTRKINRNESDVEDEVSNALFNDSVTKENKFKRKRLSLESDSEDDEDTTVDTQKLSQSKKGRKTISNESDGSDEVSNPLSNVSSVTKGKKFKRKRLSLESDSENDGEMTVDTEKISQTKEERKTISNESDSDDEVSNVLSNVTSVAKDKKIKRKRLSLESDSEDDGETTVNTEKISQTKEEKKTISNESDSDDEVSNVLSNVTSVAKDKKIKRKRLSLESDSEDDGETTVNTEKISQTKEEKKTISNESDSDDEVRNVLSNVTSVTKDKKFKRKRLSLESDSEDNSDTAVNTAKLSQISKENESSIVTDNDTTVGKITSNESESNDAVSNALSNVTSVTKEKIFKRKRLSIESDSEDDDV